MGGRRGGGPMSETVVILPEASPGRSNCETTAKPASLCAQSRRRKPKKPPERRETLQHSYPRLFTHL